MYIECLGYILTCWWLLGLCLHIIFHVCVLSVLEIWSLECQTVLMFGFSSIEGFPYPEIFNLLSSPFPRNFIVYFLMEYLLPQHIFCSQIHSPWIPLLETGESHVGQWPIWAEWFGSVEALAIYSVRMVGARAALAFYTTSPLFLATLVWCLLISFHIQSID